MPTFTAVYDACVLYPAPLRDLLLQLATAGLFRARWTAEIHDEWTRNVLKNNPHYTREQLERTRNLMDRAVPDCLVSGHDYLIPAIDLPDPDDRHVLAAAIHSRADAVVTYNLRDFPEKVLEQYGIEAIHPDEFLNFQMDLDEAAVLVAAQTCRTRLRNPPKQADEYIDILERQGLPKLVSTLRRYSALI